MAEEYVTCSNCGQEMTRAYYESQHKYQCPKRSQKKFAEVAHATKGIKSREELSKFGDSTMHEFSATERVPESEIEKEMREHGRWADRQIAEQIARDHLHVESKFELWLHGRRGELVESHEVEAIEVIAPYRMIFGGNRLDIFIDDWEIIKESDKIWRLKPK